MGHALSPVASRLAIAGLPQIDASPESWPVETRSLPMMKSVITDRRRQGARKYMKAFGKSILGIVALCAGLNVAAAQGAGGNWSYSQTDIGAGAQRITLGYAEQGTTLFSMMCDNTSDLVLVRANVSANLKPGQLTAVQVLVDGATLQIDGNYRDASNGNPGVYHAFEINKAFFASFPHSEQLKFGIPGQTYINASMDADRQTFTRFIGMCNVLISDYREKIAAANQPQPETQPQPTTTTDTQFTGVPATRTTDARWALITREYPHVRVELLGTLGHEQGEPFVVIRCNANHGNRLVDVYLGRLHHTERHESRSCHRRRGKVRGQQLEWRQCKSENLC